MTESVFEAAGLLRGSSAAALQSHLLREPGAHHAEANPVSQVVTVGCDETTVSAERIRRLALTLAAWSRRLEGARDQAIALAGEDVYRTWRLYMAGVRLGFERGEIDVLQALHAKPASGGPASRPLRPWW